MTSMRVWSDGDDHILMVRRQSAVGYWDRES